MKKLSFSIALAFICIMAVCQSSAEEKVWQQTEVLSKAVFGTKDSLALLDLVDEKVTYGHSGGNVEDKATMIRNAVANAAIYKNSLLERLSVDVERKTAVVRYNFRAVVVDKGAETPLDIGIIQVWKKKSRKWQLWARQAVKIPVKS